MDELGWRNWFLNCCDQECDRPRGCVVTACCIDAC